MLLLDSCTALPPGEEGRREASIPAVPPLVRRAPARVIRTEWTFRAGDDECTAIAAAAGTSLSVTVRRNTPIRLMLLLPSSSNAPSLPVRFRGPAGGWVASARRFGARQLNVTLGADQDALSRVLVLLNGGTLQVGEPAQPIALFVIRPSEAQGQGWFDCAREKML